MNIRDNRVNMVTCKIDKLECIKQMGVYLNAILLFINGLMSKILILLISNNLQWVNLVDVP